MEGRNIVQESVGELYVLSSMSLKGGTMIT